MLKKLLTTFLAIIMLLTITACEKPNNPNTGGGAGNGGNELDGTVYNASEIATFGSGTPYGFAIYDSQKDTTMISILDTSLDNYGGLQTPSIELDFSKAVIFQMEVVSCYTQYIVKLAVAGEKEYFYVLSDEGKTGLISVNVVDAMLCDKYREKNTQPDPGYANGWKYKNQKKRCTFHILAKGPSGEQRTGYLEVKNVAIYNDQEAVTNVSISGSENLTATKGSNPVQLTASISPQTVGDKKVIWTSLDNSVATVTENGLVNFVGVGRTKIVATSQIDQSKSATAEVRVLSGYEDLSLFKTALSDLSENDTEKFSDLFLTEWNDMYLSANISSRNALNVSLSDGKVYVENYFDNSNSTMQNQANSDLNGNNVETTAELDGISNGAEVYSLVNGKVVKSFYNGSLKLGYAIKDGTQFSKSPSYTEKVIIVSNEKVKKLTIEVKAVTEIARYSANDFADGNKWIIPDRNKESEDSVVHALSPASVRVEGNDAIIKQNKYQESAFCFGGLVSNLMTVETEKSVQVVIDVKELNKKSDFVKTMWEIKIIYFRDTEGQVPVSANPTKLDGSNQTGKFTITFNPNYNYFRIYLVVNGSDIGEQFSDATMKIGSLKIQSID